MGVSDAYAGLGVAVSVGEVVTKAMGVAAGLCIGLGVAFGQGIFVGQTGGSAVGFIPGRRTGGVLTVRGAGVLDGRIGL